MAANSKATIAISVTALLGFSFTLEGALVVAFLPSQRTADVACRSNGGFGRRLRASESIVRDLFLPV